MNDKQMGSAPSVSRSHILFLALLTVFFLVYPSVSVRNPLFEGSTRESSTNANVEPLLSTGSFPYGDGGTRYTRRIVDDFKNRTYVDRDNTTCLVNTMTGVAILSGDTHNTMEFKYDASVNGGCGDRSSWYTKNFGKMTWDEAEELANMYGAQFMGAPDFNHYGYNAPYEQFERWVGEKDSTQAYTSTGSWHRVNTRNKNEKHYAVLAYANGDKPGHKMFSKSKVVNGKLYFYKDYGTISERDAYTKAREHGARPLNPYLFGINTRAHMVENHPCHGSVQYNGAGYSHDGSSNHRYRGFIGYHVSARGTNRGYYQSLPLYTSWPTIGAARMTWYEYKPPGTDIVYNLTLDGEHWVEMKNHTDHVFEHRGSRLMWNATFTTNDEDVKPYIEKVVIEYDLISDPEPRAPVSDEWLGTAKPTLEWNFTDPDKGDHQSDFLVEIFNDTEMKEQVYNSSWVNSTEPEHPLTEDLADGQYYWRVKTKDVYHAASNFSVLKGIKIDVTKPVGNITIAEGEASVNEQLVYLAIEAVDEGSGVVDMKIINDRGSAQEWEPYKTKKRIALSPTDGSKTVGIRFRDNAGIVSEVFEDSVYLDLRGPGDIVVTSPTHPEPDRYFQSTSPVFEWEPPYEVTKIKGYSYLLDASPMSEPYKNVNDDGEGDRTQTVPGEFSGLNEGTWYFHITPCDVYDQWGNTTHFRINIDSSEPVVDDIPKGEEWYADTSVETGVVFRDVDGFGLAEDSIKYAYRKHGDADFGMWYREDVVLEVLERNMAENPVKIKATVRLELSEGDGNAVKWQVSDLSGNGPVESEVHIIKIDITPVSFFDPVPAADSPNVEKSVSCGITITDGGSGVDGATIEYAVSTRGVDLRHFKRWMAAPGNRVEETITALMMIEFDYGKNNYIRWRAADTVGNGPVMSEPSRVWVNSPPVPVITFPKDGAAFYSGEEIWLSAVGSEDNEGDELSYWWVVKNRSTKKAVFSLSGMVGTAVLDKPGNYLIYLYADDGYGFNESEKSDILIRRKASTGLQDDDEEPEEGSTGPRSSLYDQLLERWWLIAAVATVLLGLIIFIIVLIRRKRKEESAPSAVTPETGPYPTGYRDYYRPQPVYSTTPGPGTSFVSSGHGGGMPPNQALSSGRGARDTPLLPAGYPRPQGSQFFEGSSGAHYGPATQAAAAPGDQTERSRLYGEDSTPTYSLPSFSTPQGESNLNRLALPPGDVSDTAEDIYREDPSTQGAPVYSDAGTGGPDLKAPGAEGYEGQAPPAYFDGEERATGLEGSGTEEQVDPLLSPPLVSEVPGPGPSGEPRGEPPGIGDTFGDPGTPPDIGGSVPPLDEAREPPGTDDPSGVLPPPSTSQGEPGQIGDPPPKEGGSGDLSDPNAPPSVPPPAPEGKEHTTTTPPPPRSSQDLLRELFGDG